MLQTDFRKLVEQLRQLTDNQSALFEQLLKGTEPVSQIIHDLEQRIIESPECPHCHSPLINRHGKVNDMQRYRCKNGLKTFVATTGTPLARLRYKEQWTHYMRCMLDSKVLRVRAKECSINLKTSFL